MLPTLKETIASAKACGRLALGLYLIPGFPSWGASFEAVRRAVASGVDFIEIPIVGTGGCSSRTGPLIARALAQVGDELHRAEGPMQAWLDEVRVGVGVVYEGAWPEPERWQADARFLYRSQALLLEAEDNDWDARAARAAAWGRPLIATVNGLSSKWSADEQRILLGAHGFIYMSLGQRTGQRGGGVEQMRSKIASIREIGCRLPICAAFGIRNALDIGEIRAGGCDGVIIGSAAIEVLERGTRPFKRWLGSIQAACTGNLVSVQELAIPT